MLSGDNGILQKATTAKENTDSAQIKERIQLAYHSALTGGQGSYTKSSLESELKKEFGDDYSVDTTNNTNWVLTVKNQSVTIPAGIVKTATLPGKEFWQGGNLYKAYGNIYLSQGKNVNQEIKGIIHSGNEPSIETKQDEKHLWSTADSDYNVYFWVEDDIIYWWSEADRIYLNPDCNSLFAGWKSLSNIDGIKDFDSSKVTNMYGMFTGCSSLTSLDLSNWNTSNVTDMTIMFASCQALTTIYVSDRFVTTSVTSSGNMFGGCDLLVGGNGTSMSSAVPGESEYYDATRARIDTAENPGYFTDIAVKE